MAANKYLQELKKAIDTAPEKHSKEDAAFLKKYIGTNYDIIGLTVPLQRSIFRKGYSFSKLPIEEQIPIWDSIWKQSNSHEVMTQAIIFWEKNIEKVDIALAWNCLRTWLTKIDNWAHSDGLSGFYSTLLEIKPTLILPQLKKWNKSHNPWERRQSVVSLVYYHRHREKFLPFAIMIPLVEHLLKDPHYFVQKGVGWALREIGNIYHKETFAFLKGHYKNISGVAFSAAAEKLNPKEKEELKNLRKAARKKG
jgi:3-methyladenine DNA glycosylase AlkD